MPSYDRILSPQSRLGLPFHKSSFIKLLNLHLNAGIITYILKEIFIIVKYYIVMIVRAA